MRARLEIKVPKGMAKGFVNRKRFFLLRMILRIKKNDLNRKNVTINDEDNLITWYVEGTLRKIMRIKKSIDQYEVAVRMIFEHNLMKKLLKKKYSEEDQKEVEFMLTNMTSIKLYMEQ